METNNKNAGFTLIELIMTIVVISIVVIPSVVFLTESIRGTFKSEDVISAVNLARMEIEKTNNMAYTDIAAEDFTDYEGYHYDLSKEVAFIEGAPPPASGVMEIRIGVYSAGNLGDAQELLTTVVTYRSNYGS